MDELVFRGRIMTGRAGFAAMVIPGREALETCPDDWPDTIARGSLNVLVDMTALPARFVSAFPGMLIPALDSGRFTPAFEIPRDLIKENQLTPRPDAPRGGDAQVWRARLTAPAAAADFGCWVLRRFGSGLTQELEIVSDKRLRETFGLKDGQLATVTMFGDWRDT